MFLPERLVTNDIAVKNYRLICIFTQALHLLLGEVNVNCVGLLGHSLENQVTLLANNDTSLLKATNHGNGLNAQFRLFVVINAKTGKQELVLVGTETSIENLLGLSGRLPSLQDKCPEGSIVKVVDVCIGLSPRDIIADILDIIRKGGKTAERPSIPAEWGK